MKSKHFLLNAPQHRKTELTSENSQTKHLEITDAELLQHTVQHLLASGAHLENTGETEKQKQKT